MKTSGKTGLHVLTPWTEEGGFDEARAWALELAEQVAEAMPDRATVEIRKAKRGERVYIDVLQNARGHHAVPPYVLRAVPGATISTPLDWKEVTTELDPASFTAKKAPGPESRPAWRSFAGSASARKRRSGERPVSGHPAGATTTGRASSTRNRRRASSGWTPTPGSSTRSR